MLPDYAYPSVAENIRAVWLPSVSAYQSHAKPARRMHAQPPVKHQPVPLKKYMYVPAMDWRVRYAFTAAHLRIRPNYV